MNLSPHFTLEELIDSAHKEIDNYPPTDEIKENLLYLARHLELLRSILGFPIIINSGFRCPQLNELLGGSKNSRHMLGLAADLVCPKFGTPKDICIKIAQLQPPTLCPFDQLIYEKSWVHFGIAAKGMPFRRDVLTLVGPNTYARGLVAV